MKMIKKKIMQTTRQNGCIQTLSIEHIEITDVNNNKCSVLCDVDNLFDIKRIMGILPWNTNNFLR